jgi:hypothetical protein
MRRLAEPATASPYAQVLGPSSTRPPSRVARSRGPGIAAPDDRTVVIRVQNPTPYLLGLWPISTSPVHGQRSRNTAQVRASRSHGLERRIRARGLDRGLARSRGATELLERRRDAARARALPASPTAARSSGNTARARWTSPPWCRRSSSAGSGEPAGRATSRRSSASITTGST